MKLILSALAMLLAAVVAAFYFNLGGEEFGATVLLVATWAPGLWLLSTGAGNAPAGIPRPKYLEQ